MSAPTCRNRRLLNVANTDIHNERILAVHSAIKQISMKTVYDSVGGELGKFDGRFVFDSADTKRYWIDGNEVFSMPPLDLDGQSSVRAAIKVADLIDGVAIDSDGTTVFRLSTLLFQLSRDFLTED